MSLRIPLRSEKPGNVQISEKEFWRESCGKSSMSMNEDREWSEDDMDWSFKIQDEKQKKELVAKETCAREGHTGEWHEHEYTVWAICGDRGFERYCPITKKNWTRICTRCREQETVDVEPIEVTRLHELQEINDMEEKLKQMKSE